MRVCGPGPYEPKRASPHRPSAARLEYATTPELGAHGLRAARPEYKRAELAEVRPANISASAKGLPAEGFEPSLRVDRIVVLPLRAHSDRTDADQQTRDKKIA